MKRLLRMLVIATAIVFFGQSAEAGLIVRLSPLSFSPSTDGLAGYAAGVGWLVTADDHSYQWSVLEADFANSFSGGDGDLLITSTYLFGGKPAGIFWTGLRGGLAYRMGAGEPEFLGAGVLRFTPADHLTYYEGDLGVSSTGEIFVQLTLALEVF